MDSIKLKDDPPKRFSFNPLSLDFARGSRWEEIKNDLTYLLPWFKNQKEKFYLTFILFVFATLFTLSLPRVIGLIIDNALLKKEWSASFSIILFTTLTLLKMVCDLSYKWNLIIAGQSITSHLREDIYLEFIKKPMAFYDQNNSGKIMSRVVSDINNLSTFFSTNFFSVFSDLILIFGSLFLIFTISIPTASVIAVALIFLLIYMLNVTLAMMDWSKETRQLLSRINSSTTDSLNNLSILHTSPYLSFWKKRNNRLQFLFSKNMYRALNIWGFFSSTHALVMGLSFASIIWICFHQLENKSITYGDFVTLFSYSLLCFTPFMDISDKVNTLLTALSSVFRLKEILPKQAKIQTLTSEHFHNLQGDILIKDLSFSYHANDSVLKNLNFTIPNGKITALAGRTGSGKSTLVQLLLRFYPINHGEILWGETPLNLVGAQQLSNEIGFVSQDLFFFQDTLRENIRLYDQSISDEMIIEVLKRLNIFDKLNDLPNGLSTLLMSDTLTLSQGEKQLLTIARLWLKKPKLLIFDEATAHLDQETENLILNSLQELFKDKTVLFIAHRLHSLTMCDQVVVMSEGEISKIIQKNPGQKVVKEDLW